MSESGNPIDALLQHWNVPPDTLVAYVNNHVATHSNKEIHLLLGCNSYPDTKVIAKCRILLTERHALELIHSLQSQVNRFIEERKGESEDEPPTRK